MVPEVTIIDIAPKRTTIGNTKVGVAGYRRLRHLQSLGFALARRVETPRLAASNGADLFSLVEKNTRAHREAAEGSLRLYHGPLL
jgi:hypothetical protein